MPNPQTLAMTASAQADAMTIPAPPLSKRPRRAGPFGRSHGRTMGEARTDRKPFPLPLFLLLFSLQIPWIIPLGPVRLTPYRIVLLLLVPLLLYRWWSGGAGRKRMTDIALLLLCIWAGVAMVAVHGVDFSVEPVGIFFIEAMGGFLVARCYIRDEDTFYRTVRMLFIITVILLPFALIESVTGRNLIMQAFRMVLPTYGDAGMPLRWGLNRAQVNLLHPIHFGLTIGCTLTLTWLVLGYGKPLFNRLMKAGLVFFTSFLSLSSGPLTSVVAQIGLMVWNRVFARVPMKWGLMAAGGVTLFILTELFANRSLAVILISLFAFDEHSAYIRTLTWQYGTESILNHPLWGTGLGMWEKPDWLTESIDMYWIINAVRHGILGGVLTFAAFIPALYQIGRKPLSDEKLKAYRAAYMYTMASFFIAGWAVHYWESTYILFVFLLGSGFWILDCEEPPAVDKRRARNRPRRPSRSTTNS
ncbi:MULTISPECIES: hypothetical protein [unclassified Aminobacter]|uniref:O-antigen ligase family protein n=1 Tax=unclassified Aminobacter TaxID=2644704 RepID=UPI0011A61729|nr:MULTISPECIES: hypothetical protein [unclassified Aminobacter]